MYENDGDGGSERMTFGFDDAGAVVSFCELFKRFQNTFDVKFRTFPTKPLIPQSLSLSLSLSVLHTLHSFRPPCTQLSPLSFDFTMLSDYSGKAELARRRILLLYSWGELRDGVFENQAKVQMVKNKLELSGFEVSFLRNKQTKSKKGTNKNSKNNNKEKNK